MTRNTKSKSMTWRGRITNHFQDANGNFNLGVTNGMTPSILLRKMGFSYDPNTAAGREMINRARIELNAFCMNMCFLGYVAGSIGREPSTYFIAESKAEMKMILGKSAKNLVGRLNLFSLRGKDVLEYKEKQKLSKSLKLIELRIPKEDQVQ